MAKQYAVLSADLQRSYGNVTRKMAFSMVTRGEAAFVGDRRAIQLISKFPVISYPHRGVSASPDARLIQRYTEAQNSGNDRLAIAAVEGWAP